MPEINYCAIAIDTSVFRNNGFDFEGYPLKKMEQFSQSPIQVLIPEIVHKEVHEQLSSTIKKASDKISSTLSTIEKHRVLDASVIESLKDSISRNQSAEAIAEDNLQQFYEDVGAELISVDEVDASKLFEMYFNRQSPFGKDKKKSEFPDAAALLSLDDWAEQYDMYVVLVCSDGDWKGFADTNDRFLAFDEIDKALQFFQPQENVEAIKAFLASENVFASEEFLESVSEHCQSLVENMHLDAYADSIFEYQIDDEYFTFEDFSFGSDNDGNIKFSVTKIEGTQVSLTIPLTIHASVSASFSCYVHDSIDKDYIYMGGDEQESTVDVAAGLYLDLDLLVSEGHSCLREYTIKSINTGSQWIRVEFNEISPFSEEDYEHRPSFYE